MIAATRTALRILVVAGALAGADAVHAAPCGGFTDVDSTTVSGESCLSVEWLKNRLITLGCRSSTTYCPGDDVLRVTMAAFLNRLGKALTPETVSGEDAGGFLDLEPTPVVCATNAMTIAGYPRQAQASGVVSVRASADPANVDVRLVQSTDGGASWTPVNAQPMSAGATNKWVNATVNKFGLPLAEGASYRFGIRLSRSASPANTGDLLAWNCQIAITLFARTGASSPF